MKRYKFSLVITLVVTLLVSSFSPAVLAKRPGKPGGEFKYAIVSDPVNLNPAISSDSASSDITQFVFSALLTRDAKTNLIPDMAVAMPTISSDNKTITFKIKDNIKWHDGVKLTSADIKFSYEFILNKDTASPRYGNFEKIDKIECPDDYTVVFKLKEPDSALLPNFAFGYVIPKHIWEKVDPKKVRESEYNKKPIGNGPYKFIEWKPGERVVLEAFKDFYSGRPNFDKVILPITASQTAATLKVETGESDMTLLSEADIARFKTKTNVNTYVYDRLAFDAVIYNLKNPLFSDVKVRQALTYGLNKKAIVDGMYKGVGTIANGSYHPKMWSYSSDVYKYDYNIAKANQLLDEAGWKRGKDGIREKNGKKFSFVLLTNKGNVIREKLVVIVQSQWKLLGIKVEPRIVEWNTFLNNYLYPSKFEAYVGGFTTSLDGDQTAFYYSDMKKGSLNRGGYSNPKVDKLLDDARKTFDRTQQKKYYAEVQKQVSYDLPFSFIACRRQAYAVNKKVIGVKVLDLLGFMNFEDWYMQ